MQCRASKLNGQPCANRALRGSRFCFFHDPDSSIKRRVAQQNGGKVGKRTLSIMTRSDREYDITSSEDIKQILQLVLNEILRGEREPREAYAVGYLVDIASRTVAFAERIARLERLVQVEHTTPPAAEPSAQRFVFEEEAVQEEKTANRTTSEASDESKQSS